MKRISMQRKSTVSLDEAFEFFIRKCKVKNLTDVSIRSYEDKVLPFKKFYGDRPLDEISSSTIDEYILWLQETRGNAITINSYLRSVKAFLYYCMSCGYVPTFKIHLIKAEKTIKPTYTEEELKRLLKKPDVKTCKFSTYKIWVFENYLLATGNRISSALNVRIEDVNFESGFITIRKTKNRKQQMIPLSKTLADILTEYLEYRQGNPEDYLFCNDFGERSSRSTYQQLVAKYNISRNVNKTSVHMFRHTFAKLWILNHGDVFRLQKILGHSTIAMTREYVNMFEVDLKRDFDDFSPLDNIKLK